MIENIKSILSTALVGFVFGSTAHAQAQMLSENLMDVRQVTPPETSVCQNPDVTAQIREALRLVCAQKGSDEARTSAQRLIVIGFLGGFAKDGDTKHPEVWFGAYLREHYPSAIEVSVISNHQWRKAKRDVLRLLDADHDGVLTAAEKGQAKIIVFGHSWGASEASAFARDLEHFRIPVLLTIQIDIVSKPGQNSILMPPNVEAAINFFQSEGPLHGRRQVVAEDPGRTEILGNFHMTYEGHRVDCRNYPWFARTFNKPHHEIENDARVWNQIALVIDSRLSSLRSPIDQTGILASIQK
jgi:pimeloyl-ACP methyl ester carboxylesterase